MSAVLRSFPPVADERCRLLILGSMPGEESQRQQQYYAFRYNVFWRIMGVLFQFDPGLSYEQRLQCLLTGHVALWDTLACCERDGSLDSNIRTPVPNDIPGLLANCPLIHTVFCNGTASHTFLKQCHPYLFKQDDLTIIKLPSTSPAAARYSFEEKLKIWRTAVIRTGEYFNLP